MRSFFKIKKIVDNMIEEQYIICRTKTRRKLVLGLLNKHLNIKKDEKFYSNS